MKSPVPKRRRRWIVGALVIVVAATFFGPLDYALKYMHFKTLTKEKLVNGSLEYIRIRPAVRQRACLYVVNCDDGKARLELVEDIAAWDFEEAKRSIWRRRFDNFCPGLTTNFGLQLIPMEGAEPDSQSEDLARWSFFNDRFIPRLGRFQSGAFSDQPWEECTPEKALRF